MTKDAQIQSDERYKALSGWEWDRLSLYLRSLQKIQLRTILVFPGLFVKSEKKVKPGSLWTFAISARAIAAKLGWWRMALLPTSIDFHQILSFDAPESPEDECFAIQHKVIQTGTWKFWLLDGEPYCSIVWTLRPVDSTIGAGLNILEINSDALSTEFQPWFSDSSLPPVS